MTNAEKYKTAKERADAFGLFCDKNFNIDLKNCCEFCELNGCSSCEFAWLDLEAEEEKPLPCPFCGEDCTEEVLNGAFVVSCYACTYRGMLFESKIDAIAAHNRVAKAVMDAKEKTKEGGAE